jgi:3-dehydrosphinganine reductase
MLFNPFKGKNILITGGSRGIGLEMAREFGRHGANLALIARGKDDLQSAKSALEAIGKGISVRAYACDVTNAETLADYINMIQFELGPLDGVVANSGYCHPGNFHELKLADFDRQIDTNLRGAIYTIHLALPHLLQNPKGGFVALTSSPAGHMGIFGFSAYGPTKAALSNLADTLHAEYGDRGIRVHLLLPPDTDTPGYREEVKLYPPECRAVLAGGSLLGAEFVAKKLVSGIADNKRRIAVGFEARVMMTVLRAFPGFWNIYTNSKKRAARKRIEAKKSTLTQPQQPMSTDSSQSAPETSQST